MLRVYITDKILFLEEHSMIDEENIVSLVNDFRKRYNIGKGHCDAQRLCDGFNADLEETLFLLCVTILGYSRQVAEYRALFHREQRKSEALEESYDELLKNKIEKQRQLVKHGLPIAKKRGADIWMMEMFIRMGMSEEEIKEKLGVSRTTLWRWKKRLREKGIKI